MKISHKLQHIITAITAMAVSVMMLSGVGLAVDEPPNNAVLDFSKMANITTSPEGSWSWSPDTKTLTISDLELSVPAGSGGGIILPSNAIIVMSGMNRIIIESTENEIESSKIFGIKSLGNLTVSGTGSLYVNMPGTGIIADGNVDLQVSDLSVHGSDSAVKAEKDITILSENITLSSDNDIVVMSNTGRIYIQSNEIISISCTNENNNHNLISAEKDVTLCGGKLSLDTARLDSSIYSISTNRGDGTVYLSGRIEKGSNISTDRAVIVPTGKVLVNDGTITAPRNEITVFGTLLGSGTTSTPPNVHNLQSLFVNGVNVFSTNNYTVSCGNGTAVYSPTYNTLTLTNCSITRGYSDSGLISGIYADGNLQIVLEGSNTIDADLLTYGIFNKTGSIDVSGSGTLDVHGSRCGIYVLDGALNLSAEVSMIGEQAAVVELPRLDFSDMLTVDDNLAACGKIMSCVNAGHTYFSFTENDLNYSNNKLIGALGNVNISYTLNFRESVNVPIIAVGERIENIDLTKLVTGGTAPFTFTSANLPGGISVTSDGILQGTPTETSMPKAASVTVIDSSGHNAAGTINFSRVVEVSGNKVTALTTNATVKNTDFTEIMTFAVEQCVGKIELVFESISSGSSAEFVIPTSSLSCFKDKLSSVTIIYDDVNLFLNSSGIDTACNIAGGNDITVKLYQTDGGNVPDDGFTHTKTYNIDVSASGVKIITLDGAFLVSAEIEIPENSESVMYIMLNSDAKKCDYSYEGDMLSFSAIGSGEYIFAWKPSEIEPGWQNPFDDVNTDDWFFSSVEYVCERGIMNGISDEEFMPYYGTSRSMLVTILYRQSGSPETEFQDVFSDVEDGAWYSAPVIWAYENDITTGNGDGTFGVDDGLTRQQLATFLYRYAKFLGRDVSDSTGLSHFPDKNLVADYAGAAMEWAVAAKIITGKDGLLEPNSTAKRCETAAMIQRFDTYYLTDQD